MNTFEKLFAVIQDRQQNPIEKSYTCYLFEQGTDKICKKVGEESAETIIAAKNGSKEELKNEICDLIYHVFTLAANEGVDISEIEEELEERSAKIGNLKDMKKTDKNT
ncbi:MAG: phosphoribosyl-ATP diphosphatase [Eubacteriales bacterium]|nr:phosphoribosyl-ATP diphosphatase [Eubacteriales bacterium]MDD4476335.1 phosphoribosyl-ATP diphosphatase [Eubacteriales bacterium]